MQDIVPSGSKISRSMLLLDVAYVCYWQERLTGFNAGDNLVYLWLDSSPQGGVDWLLSIVRFVKRDQVQACVQAALLWSCLLISLELLAMPTICMK